MKKLKVALIAIFAMLMSLCLFACKDDKGNGSSKTIRSVSVNGESSFIITDADGVDEASRLQAFNEAIAELELRVYYQGESRPGTLESDACTFDTSAVDWETIGTYRVTVTPTADNPKKVSTEISITIDHDFQKDPDNPNVEVCSVDGARRTTEALTDTYIAYDGFHGGPTSASKSSSSQLKPFGTIDYNGEERTVKTYTAGSLTRGMTITLKGDARATYGDKGVADAGYYFPILGVGVKEYDSTQSPFGVTNGYSGGASIIARNEGWVLMNGIGGGTTADPALLGGLVGGSSDAHNYPSHPDDPDADGRRPSDYGTEPVSAENWKDWYTYSSGTTHNSTNYTVDKENPVQVTFTWTFRMDGVAEYIYGDDTAGTSLIVRVKIPDNIETIESILHGEYVEMNFTSLSTVETRTLSDIRYQGVNEEAQTVYAENQMFDPASIVVQANYAQSPDVWENTANFSVSAYTQPATLTDGKPSETVAADVANWVDLAETPLSTAMSLFKIETRVGNVTKEVYVEADEFVGIIENRVGYGLGYDYDATHPNEGAIGEFGYSVAGEAGEEYVLLAPSGVANTVGTDKYISFRIYAESKMFNTTGLTLTLGTAAAGDKAQAKVADDGSYVDVLVYVDAETVAQDLTIAGLQDTDVVIDLAGISGATVTSAVTLEGDVLPVNKGGKVTIVYTIPAATWEQVGELGNNSIELSINGVARSMRYFDFDTEALTFGGENNFTQGGGTIPVSGSISVGADATTITVSYTLPALTAFGPDSNLAASGFYAFGLNLMQNGTMATQAVDNVYYTGAAADVAGSVTANFNGLPVTVTADGNVLRFAAISYVTDVPAFNTGSVWLNANDGDAALVRVIDLGFTYGENGVVYNDDELGDIYSVGVAVMGTVNNSSDVDRGFTLVGEVDLSAFGVEGSSFYFQMMSDLEADAQKNIYKVTFTEGSGEEDDVLTIAQETVEAGEAEVLLAATCTTDGVYGHAVKDAEENILFIYDFEYLPGGHTFAADADYEHAIDGYTYYSGVCSVCEEIAGWKVEGVQVGSTANNVNYGPTHGKNFAYNPGVGELYSVIYKGQTVTATGVATSAGTNVWQGFAPLLYLGDMFINTTNMRVDNYMNYVGGQSGTISEYMMNVASAVSGEADIAAAQAAMSADGGAPASIVWDWSDEAEIVVTITITTDSGDYICTYTYTPAGDNFEKNSYSIGIAADGGSFTGDIVAAGADTTNYNTAKEHIEIEIDYDEDGPFVIGTEGNGTGWTPKQHTLPIDKGEKLVVSGPMTSAGVSQWQAPVVAVYSGASAVGIMRADNYVLDNAYASIGIQVALNDDLDTDKSYTDYWAQVAKVITACTATYTIDWSNESKIVVTMQFVSAEEGTYTMTYTLTAMTGYTLADRYSVDFGCDTCYANFTSFERVEAHTHTFASEGDNADRCTVCGMLNPNHGNTEAGGLAHDYDATTHLCTICGAVDPDHTCVDTDPEDGKCDICGEDVAHTCVDANPVDGKCDICGEDVAHEHSYVSDTASEDYDKCTVCGALNPVHGQADGTAHVWINGVCKACDAQCAHEGVTTIGATCSVCGGTLSQITEEYSTEGKPALSPWANGTTDVSIVAGEEVVLNATYADAGTERWTGLVLQVKSASGTLMYFFRPAGDYASYNASNELVWNVPYGSGTVTAPGFVADDAAADYTAAKKTSATKITVSLNAETDTMTVVYQLLNAEGTATDTKTWTVTGMSDSIYTLGFALDGCTVTEDGVTISAQGFVYNSAE